MARERAAQPKFTRGDVVFYSDHTNRPQTGKILTIECRWQFSEIGRTPFITYSVAHPTYRGKRIYLAEKDLRSAR